MSHNKVLQCDSGSGNNGSRHIFISVLSPISETFHIKDSSTRPLLSMDRPMPRGRRDSAWPPPWRGPDISRPIHAPTIASYASYVARQSLKQVSRHACRLTFVALFSRFPSRELATPVATRGSPCMIEDEPISEQ
jgi:hypothetical protein